MHKMICPNIQLFNIKLEEAMTMKATEDVRLWNVFGLHFKDDEVCESACGVRRRVKRYCENVCGIQTYVMMSKDAKFFVYVCWKTQKERVPYVKNGKIYLPFDEETEEHTKVVAEISSLEELKNKFPKLFELEGIMFAFSE